MPTEKEVLAQASASLDLVDAATTKAGAAATAIQARIEALMAEIAGSSSLEEAQAIAARAAATAGQLGPIAEALTAMGNAGVPVPVPPVEPPPEPSQGRRHNR